MAMRFREVYDEIKELGVQLVAGSSGLERPVRWVHMVETPDVTRFLDGQEIAIVTGVGIGSDSEEQLIKIVKDAYEHEVSGILVNTGPFIHQIPEETISFCDEHNLPLLRASWDVHMGKVMRVIGALVLDSEKGELELASGLHNAILHPDQQEFYLAHLEHNGFEVDWAYCTIVLEPHLADGSPATPEDLAHVGRATGDLIVSDGMRAGRLTMDGREVLVMAGCDAEQARQAADRALDACLAALGDDAGPVYVGMGKVTHSARCIAKSYAQAHKLCQVQARRGASDAVAAYNESGVFRLLLSVDDEEVLSDFVESTIGPLVAYDRARSSDHVETLRIYLACSGSVRETAERMFVHRNTVTYKLNRTAEILGMDLSDFSVREQLDCALKVLELIDA